MCSSSPICCPLDLQAEQQYMLQNTPTNMYMHQLAPPPAEPQDLDAQLQQQLMAQVWWWLYVHARVVADIAIH